MTLQAEEEKAISVAGGSGNEGRVFRTTVYHLMPELEPFSTVRGGALSRDVAHILRLSEQDVVVCADADESWGFSSERVILLPQIRRFDAIRGKRFLPTGMTGPIIRGIFRPLLARLKPGDVVWCHNQLAFSAALARPVRKAGAKIIHHFHDGHAHFAARTALRSFTPDASIFVSDYLMSEWKRVRPLHCAHAVPNGADDSTFFPATGRHVWADGIPVVLFAGRLHPEKGAHVLVEAMRILERRNVKALCRMIGSATFAGGNATPYAQALLKSLPSNVRFEGKKPYQRIAEEFRSASIVCCPSVWQEPFGNVNIEAMACAVPVVASKVGGIPEIAAEGGILLAEPNSPASFADALERLLTDESLRARIGTEGLHSFRRRYTWPAVCKRYREIIAAL